MAQIIRHRRGSLEALSAVTSSLQKGELVIASGSSNLTTTNGASIVFAVPETGQVQAVNRFLIGTNAPNIFSSSVYNGLVKGVPYYASGSSTLFLLGEGSNDIPNLVGNIQVFSASVDTRLDSLEASIGNGGSVGTRVTNLETISASLNTSASNHESRIDLLEASQSAFDTAFDVSGTNVTVTGNLTVQGTTTTIDSTTIQLGDNIIALNGTGAANGGLLVKDVTAPNTVSGSLLWDSTSDFWKAGVLGAEHKILTVDSGVVSGSSQITLSSTTGFTTYSGSVATTNSASNANIASLSASVSTVTGNFSSSVATSFSASAASVTSLSTSVNSRLVTVEAVSASAAVALNSISGAIATRNAEQDVLISSLQTNILSASVFTTFSTSVDSRLDTIEGTFSTSVDSRLDSVELVSSSAAVALNSISGAIATRDIAQDTLISSLQTNILSASVFNTFSTSVDSRLDSVELVSSSAAVALNTISGAIATKDVAQDVLISSLQTNILSASVFTTFSTSVDSRLDTAESFSGAFNTAFGLDSSNVTIKGNLTVQGTTTQVDSTTVNINDNIISLNAAGTSDGGIIVKDATGATTTSGSLLYDVTGDFWKAGASGAEHKILTVASGVVSGSSQITYANISSIPAGIVSGSSQITLSSTTGFTTYSGSVATTNSASVATAASQLSSVSASVATSFSASAASQTALSSSVATSFSASAASVTSLSTSVDSRLDTLEGNVGQALNTNSSVTFTSITSSVNLGVTAGNTKRIAFRNTNGNLDLVPTASVAGDLLQFDGTDFVMSNTIDGGSF